MKGTFTVLLLGLITTNIFSQSIQERLDSGETPFEIYLSNDSVRNTAVFLYDSIYGKTYAGGLVAYMDVKNGGGIVVTAEDYGPYKWACPAYTYNRDNGYFSSAIGGGVHNENMVLPTCPDSGAIAFCNNLNLNGNNDWVLPSTDDIKKVRANLYLKHEGNLSGNYWTSYIWRNWPSVLFTDTINHSGTSVFGADSMGTRVKVRPVRYFPPDIKEAVTGSIVVNGDGTATLKGKLVANMNVITGYGISWWPKDLPDPDSYDVSGTNIDSNGNFSVTVPVGTGDGNLVPGSIDSMMVYYYYGAQGQPEGWAGYGGTVGFRVRVPKPCPGVQEQLNYGSRPIDLYNSNPSCLDSMYGKWYRGGMIAYLNTENGSGFVTAGKLYGVKYYSETYHPSTGKLTFKLLKDSIQTVSPPYSKTVQAIDVTAWTNGPENLIGTNTGIGTGMSNTKKIVAALDSGLYAASWADTLVYHGYDDWFLPSKDELEAMYNHLIVDCNCIDGSTDFWSSTESSASEADYNKMYTGYQGSAPKTATGYGVYGCRYFDSTSAITNNMISSNDQVVCQSGGAAQPAQINAQVPTGGTGTYTYSWQVKKPGTEWQTAQGGTASSGLQNFTPASVASSTLLVEHYRRIVTSNNVRDTSESVSVTFVPSGYKQIITVSQSSDVSSGIVLIPSLSHNVGNYTTTWQIWKKGWTNLPASLNPDLNVGELNTPSIYYKALITYGGACPTDTSQVIGFTPPDSNGNIYPTILVGAQVWMMNNLRATKYNDGTQITEEVGNSAWATGANPAYCWYHDDSVLNALPYGVLYNNYVLRDTSRNICPQGWRIGTTADWSTLIGYVGDQGRDSSAKVLKAMNTWIGPNNGTNAFNFSALPGGERSASGVFSGKLTQGSWWAEGERGRGSYYVMTNIGANVSFVNTSTSGSYKNEGHSIRCIKK